PRPGASQLFARAARALGCLGLLIRGCRFARRIAMAMVDFSCRVPSTIRWHRHSAPWRLAPVTDASPPTSSKEGLLGNDLRAKRADPVTARTPARPVLATPARGSTKARAVQARAAGIAAAVAGISNTQSGARENWQWLTSRLWSPGGTAGHRRRRHARIFLIRS